MAKPSIPRTCSHCGSGFLAKPENIAKGGGKFCSPTCYRTGRMRPLAERLWEKTVKTDSCWIYNGKIADNGYGRISIGRKEEGEMTAHGAAYQVTYGPIPEGMLVCHKCDNPPCVRPDHLFLGTHADNMQDRQAKGRQARGSKCLQNSPPRGDAHYKTTLTSTQIQAIRSQYESGSANMTQLAKVYGVHKATIRNIIRRRTWQHVV